jgi:hypothetical protein
MWPVCLCLSSWKLSLYEARSFAVRFLVQYGHQGRIPTNPLHDRVGTAPHEDIHYRQIFLETVAGCVVDERRKIARRMRLNDKLTRNYAANYDAHARSVAADAYWKQVRRTVNGEPIAAQIMLIVNAVVTGPSLLTPPISRIPSGRRSGREVRKPIGRLFLTVPPNTPKYQSRPDSCS